MTLSPPHRTRPGPGQESVWDYPRPPRLEKTTARLQVVVAGITLADSLSGYRVLETSHPPVYYLPPQDLRLDLLQPAPGRTLCEFKGTASYWRAVIDGRDSGTIAWSYPEPTARFAAIRDHLAFYPSRVDRCLVDDEIVRAQEGDFYGGWITAEILGPFKGGPGTLGW